MGWLSTLSKYAEERLATLFHKFWLGRGRGLASMVRIHSLQNQLKSMQCDCSL